MGIKNFNYPCCILFFCFSLQAERITNTSGDINEDETEITVNFTVEQVQLTNLRDGLQSTPLELSNGYILVILQKKRNNSAYFDYGTRCK